MQSNMEVPVTIGFGGTLGNVALDLVWENSSTTMGEQTVTFDNGIEYDYFIIDCDNMLFEVGYGSKGLNYLSPVTPTSNVRIDIYSRTVTVSKVGTQVSMVFSNGTYYRISSASPIGSAISGSDNNGVMVPLRIYGVIKKD